MTEGREQGNVIDAESLVVRESIALASSGGVSVRRKPTEVLDEGRSAAAALMTVISSKKKPVVMNGERYLEIDDWQVIGRFYGCTPYVESVTFRVYEIPGQNPIFGFDCVALLKAPDGRVICRAEASCLSDEEKWGARPKYVQVYAKECKTENGHKVKNAKGEYIVTAWWDAGFEPTGDQIVWVPNPHKQGKTFPLKKRELVGTENVPLFQIKSMAQTRATSKVLSTVFRFVPVLAGVQGTPAEEMPGYHLDRSTGELTEPPEHMDERNPPPAGTAPARTSSKPAPSQTSAPATTKPTETKPAEMKSAGKKAGGKGNPVYKGEAPPPAAPPAAEAPASALPEHAVIITNVAHAVNGKKQDVWQVTYTDREEHEHQVVTLDKDIAECAEAYRKEGLACLLTATKGKLKFAEIDEIGPVEPVAE